MSEISVTLPDGSSRRLPAGCTPGDVAGQISAGLARVAVAANVDGRLVDLTTPLGADATVRIVTPHSPEALALYRHSTAHLLAAAVTSLFPGAQCGIGPATEEGFFYDFVVDRPFVPEDLDAIERRMRELASADLPYERQMWPREEATRFFAGKGEALKVQLIDEKTAGQSEVSVYTIKDRDTFVDFCVGPHVPSTGRLKAFKLLSTSNAYWKGDSRNQPMQRIYGTAFLTEADLKAHLRRIEEAKTRDHRKVGKDLGLFTFHPWAPGATFWLSKGTTFYHLLADYMRQVLFPAGYVELKTPLVFNKALWETSGHWQHYRENMFLIHGRDGEEMGMKAMNCPGHMLVFASEKRSYRELPLRFHEQTPLHRNEASGVLSGLTRVRQFSQDDAHCFVTEGQIQSEVEALLRLVQRVLPTSGSVSAKLSTRPDEYLGEISTWDHAEGSLKRALESAGQAYTVNEKDGAFYGPKIDFDITDAIGRQWQCATIQLDYQLPQRFDLEAVGADNAVHRPVVIHRAIFGSLERFIALLIEHYAGAFPLWIAPVQVAVLPIADRHLGHAALVREQLASAGLRVEVDERYEKIGYKIREAQLQKIPYMLVVGDKEASEGTVSVRSRTDGIRVAADGRVFWKAALAEVRAKGETLKSEV